MSDIAKRQRCAMSGAILTDAIRDFGTAKQIARVARCSVATAARYRRGETMPDPLRLARLMGGSRRIADAMLRLAGLDDLSMDIQEARLAAELHQLRTKRIARQHAAGSTQAGDLARGVLGRDE